MVKKEEIKTGISADWKKQLKRMKLDYLQQTAPGFFELSGSYTMTIKGYTDATANGLTKCIEDYVKFCGGYANRIGTTGMMRRINGEMKWTRGNSNLGAADVRILFDGRSADIEVKIGRDVVSDRQKKEKERITKAGGLYFIARDMPSFIEWFDKELLQNRQVRVLHELDKDFEIQQFKAN
ncbi:MAG: hypothetical protein ABIN94_01130 [Ferruginibacter sp.]